MDQRRRALLLAASFVATGLPFADAAQVTSWPARVRVRSSDVPLSQAIGHVHIDVVGVDDVAEVAGIVGTIASVIDFFKGGTVDFTVVNAKLDLLARQNQEIIDRLDRIVDVLNRLDVIVSTAVREQFAQFLRSQLSGAFERYYELADAIQHDPANKRLEEQAAIRQDIIKVTREIGGYGYGVYPTMAVAYFYEDDIAGRLVSQKKLSSADRMASRRFYARFFANVLNAKLDGSVTSALQAQTSTMSTLDDVLSGADRYLAQNGRRFVVETNIEYDTGDKPCFSYGYEHTWAHHDRIQIVNGDRNSGYSIDDHFEGSYNPGEVGCPAMPLHIELKKATSAVGVKALSPSGDQSSEVNALNVAREKFIATKTNVQQLTKLQEIAKQVFVQSTA